MQQVPFKARLKAWWEGYDSPRSRAVVPERTAFRSRAMLKCRFEPAIEIRHLLFGEGMTAPLDRDPLQGLEGVVETPEEALVLMLGTETGGAAIAQSVRPGRLVLMEPDPAWREAAQTLARDREATSRLVFGPVDLERMELADNSYDLVISRLVLNGLPDREPFYTKLEKGLRRGADVILTLLTLGAEGELPDLPGDTPMHLLTAEAERQLIIEAGLRADMMEDQTDQTVDRLKDSFGNWRELVETIQRYDRKAEMMQALLDQIEYWQPFIDLMQRGDLHVTRIRAAKRENELL